MNKEASAANALIVAVVCLFIQIGGRIALAASPLEAAPSDVFGSAIIGIIHMITSLPMIGLIALSAITSGAQVFRGIWRNNRH